MTDDRLIHAFGRLEEAIARLETQLPRPSAPPEPAGDDAAEGRYARLEARHEALRQRTTAAVERLSQLLEPRPPGTHATGETDGER